VSRTVDDLAEPLRSAVATLLDRAAGRVWIISGFRTRAEQIELRRLHCGPTDYDIYERPAMECRPPTAIPGTSQHERGLAVDLGGDLGLAAYLAPSCRLTLTVPGEPWHFEHLDALARSGNLGRLDPNNQPMEGQSMTITSEDRDTLGLTYVPSRDYSKGDGSFTETDPAPVAQHAANAHIEAQRARLAAEEAMRFAASSAANLLSVRDELRSIAIVAARPPVAPSPLTEVTAELLADAVLIVLRRLLATA